MKKAASIDAAFVLLFSACQKTLQNYKCFFLRFFNFSQITDTKVSAHFQKVKISSKINHLVKVDSFLADTIKVRLKRLHNT